MISPKELFIELLNALDSLNEEEKERSRNSSRTWRAKQTPDTLKSKQRKWEKDYRDRLKEKDPARYTAYCKGNINA